LPVLRLSETVVQFYAWQVSDFEKCVLQTYSPGKFLNRYHQYQNRKSVPKQAISAGYQRKLQFFTPGRSEERKNSPLPERFFTVPCCPTGCRGNQRVLFRTCHMLWIVSEDVMFVSMSDAIVGHLRPPDESGGYRMTDVMEAGYTLLPPVVSSFRGYERAP